jgi:hypothetical protein
MIPGLWYIVDGGSGAHSKGGTWQHKAGGYFLQVDHFAV